jgi:hypothetical protein
VVLRAQKRYSNGTTFLTSYTYSKNRDRSAGGFGVAGVSGSDVNAGSTGPQKVYDLQSEWGLSIFDATHRLSMTGRMSCHLGGASTSSAAPTGRPIWRPADGY